LLHRINLKDTRMFLGFKLDFFGWRAALAALVASGSCCPAAEPALKPVEPPLPQFRQIAAMPGVQAAAKKAGIVLDGISAPVDRAKMQPGDSATFLASLTDGKKLTQWVVALRVAVLPEKLRGEARPEKIVYSNTGHVFHFTENKAGVQIFVLGPFKAPDQEKTEAKRKQVVITEEMLAAGLNGLPIFSLKMKAMRNNPAAKGKTLNISLRPQPFSEAQIDADRQMAAFFGVTESDERALAGTAPALMQFFSLITATPGLTGMLKSVIDLPFWSLLSSGLKPRIDLNSIPFEKEISQEGWALPMETKIFALPLELRINGKPSLLCQLAVIDPRPPFQTSAGVIGLAAGAPDGKGPVLTLQLVSARVAVESPAPAP
jgi:hypothetical protein